MAALSGGGLPPLFDFVTPMPYVELQKMLDGQQTPQEAAAATQKQWLAEFAKN